MDDTLNINGEDYLKLSTAVKIIRDAVKNGINDGIIMERQKRNNLYAKDIMELEDVTKPTALRMMKKRGAEFKGGKWVISEFDYYK